MLVRDIMTPSVECTCPDTSLQEAARRMKELDVGSLPVCGENERLEGILTDRDIAIRCVAEGKDPCATQVRDVMTPGILYCFDDQDLGDAVSLMENKQVRRLVVLDRNKRLIGIVSLGDLAVKGGDDELSGEVIEAVSEPVHA